MKQKTKISFKLEKYRFFKKMAFQLIFAVFLIFSITPSVLAQTELNSQKLALAEPSIGPSTIRGDVMVDNTINGTTLVPQVGPLGTTLDVASIPENTGQVFVYTVHKGDTIGSVAKMFNVTKDTVMYANDLAKGDSLKVGSVLAILPVSGQIYIVKSNSETISTIAKKFKVKPADIAIYNDLDVSSDLSKSDTLIIPDIEFTSPQVVTPKKNNISTSKVVVSDNKQSTRDDDPNSAPVNVHPMHISAKPDVGNAFLRPISIELSHLTQGSHNKGTAVDLGASVGTPIRAAYDGGIVLARDIGWNAGFGKYVIIVSNIDGNIVQHIYAHMSEVLVTAGMQVKRGDVIGRVGQTGHATGPHLHFEVRGAVNPLIADPNYTGE